MTPHPAKLAAVLAAALIAGCAQDGTLTGLNTGSISPQQTAQADPACLTLASQIAELNKDGISDKVEKAAAKKYKMKAADLTKAHELNKANADFQAKCSSYPPQTTMAAATPADSATAAAAESEAPAKTKVAKANPPVPAQKPVAAAMAPQPATAPAPQPSAAMVEQPGSQTVAQP